ncbi:hypothetical protein PSTT_09324 [Puccinia striiformis]|uniref:Uncharacterized protein n=1 Tax=Puccinia striiformis TaxID=27350 RepID=A0A2S4V8Z9_9BASI|nr:hypothetical protein PSTT_09324 [Puccinia striiformis]
MVTLHDLNAVVQSWVRKGGISCSSDYEAFRQVWDPIQSVLLRRKLINTVEDIRSCFYQAFSSKCQEQIQMILFKKNKLIPVHEDFAKFPPFKDLHAAAEEVLFNRIAPIVDSSRALNPVQETSFKDPIDVAESPRSLCITDKVSRMLQLLDDRLKKLDALEQRLTKALSASSVSTTAGCSRVICYYCHWEGHGTAQCEALWKDKEGHLVNQKGQNYFLPSGALIPFDPSRPIRGIVSKFQTSNSSTSPVDPPYRSSHGAIPMPSPTVSQSHCRRPICKSSAADSSRFNPVSSGCHAPSAQAVDSVLKKISELIIASVCDPNRSSSRQFNQPAKCLIPRSDLREEVKLSFPILGSNNLREEVKLSPILIPIQSHSSLANTENCRPCFSYPSHSQSLSRTDIPRSPSSSQIGLTNETKLAPLLISDLLPSKYQLPPLAFNDLALEFHQSCSPHSSSDSADHLSSSPPLMPLRKDNKLAPLSIPDPLQNTSKRDSIHLDDKGIDMDHGLLRRQFGVKVSPPNCAPPRLDAACISKTLPCATFVSRTRSLGCSSQLGKIKGFEDCLRNEDKLGSSALGVKVSRWISIFRGGNLE